MRSWGGKKVTSSPKKRIVPEDGGKSPVMQLNSVVLPAPFEPRTARRSPGPTVSEMSTKAARAPNSRVTPRNSSALAEPTVERRCATLSMTAAGRLCACRAGPRAIAPPGPQANDPVWREKDNRQEPEADQEPEPVAVEAERDQDVEGERLENRVEQSADECADWIADPANDGDDQDVDPERDADRPRRDFAVAPDQENAAKRRDDRREHIGRDAVGVHVEAERRHSPRVVSNALKRKPEGRPGDIGDREPAKERDAQRKIVGGYWVVPVEAQKDRRRYGVNAGVAVEDRVILVGEIKERRRDRERDHDRVDAHGAHCEGANRCADKHGEEESPRNREPPRPANSAWHSVHAEDRNDVASETGDRHLREAHHAAVTGEEHQAQRDRAEHVGPAKDLSEHKTAGDRRHDHDDDANEDSRGIDGLQPGGLRVGLRGGPGRAARAALGKRHGLAPLQKALRPHSQHEHHDQEGQNDRVGREISKPDLLGEADDDRTERRSRNRTHAADNDHDQRSKQEARVFARRQRLESSADHAGHPGKPGAEGEYGDEDELDRNAHS